MSKSSPASPLSRCSAHALWSLTVSGSVRSLCLARETGGLLVRDENHWLYLLNRKGERQAQLRAPKVVTAVAGADDGSAYAAGGQEGDIWFLAPDLMPQWTKTLKSKVSAVALDPFGQYLAVAETGGRVSLFTRKGLKLWRIDVPRTLQFLAFIPEAPFLIGSADYGLVMCLDFRGKVVWRDGLVAHVGSLAVAGSGDTIALACFTDGLNRYSLKSGRPTRLPLPEPCRLVCLSYDGKTILSAGLTNSLQILDRNARTQGQEQLEAPATALALAPLADRVAVGMANGRILSLQWR